MEYTAEYTRPYEGGYQDLPSEETPVMAEHINKMNDTLIKIEEFLAGLDLSSLGGDYALLSEAGYSLDVSMDDYYVLTISLKNKAGDVLSSKNVDLPIESMIIDVDYADGVLTLTLQNGNTVDVSIIDIVRGLVPDTRTIAGIDLKDDITADELKSALDIYDSTVMGGELKPWLYDTSGEEILVGVYGGKPLYRKSIELNMTIVTHWVWHNTEIRCDEMETIVNGFAIDENGQYYPAYIEKIRYLNRISFAFGATIDDRVMKILVIEYTKTTDAEGSGNSLTPYGIFNAKLDGIEEDIDAIEATRNLHTYTSFEQLGVSYDNTLEEVMAALPLNSKLVMTLTQGTNTLTQTMPTIKTAEFTLCKAGTNARGIAEWKAHATNEYYINPYYSGAFIGWDKIAIANEVNTALAAKAQLAEGGRFATLADFWTYYEEKIANTGLCAFLRFNDSAGWTPASNWWRAWVTSQNRLGNGQYSVTGCIFMTNSTDFYIGTVNGGSVDTSDLAVKWERLVKKSDLASNDITTSVTAKATFHNYSVIRSGNVVTVSLRCDTTLSASEVLLENLPKPLTTVYGIPLIGSSANDVTSHMHLYTGGVLQNLKELSTTEARYAAFTYICADA